MLRYLGETSKGTLVPYIVSICVCMLDEALRHTQASVDYDPFLKCLTLYTVNLEVKLNQHVWFRNSSEI